MPRHSTSKFTCPSCGKELSPNAVGCSGCGARKVDGEWADLEAYDGLDLPDDEFDYEDFIAEEFGERKKTDLRGLFWWFVALITLIAFAWLSLGGF